MFIDESQPSEVNLTAIANYFGDRPVVSEFFKITPELKRKAKFFLVHDEKIFRRTKYGIRFVLDIEMRGNILKGLHDEDGYWDFNATYQIVTDWFWWPNM